MGISSRIGYLGFGGVVGAAVILPAAAASAGTTYNSTASAEAGAVTIAGNVVPVPDNSVTATTGDSPASASLGLSTLESALSSTPLAGALVKAAPAGANLVTEAASASADGDSAACAGFLAGNCAPGHAQAITISLSLADLPGLTPPASPSAGSPGSGGSTSKSPLSGLIPSGVPTSLPKSLPKSLLPTSLLPTSLPTSLPVIGGKGLSAPMSNSAASAQPLPDLTGYALVLTISGPEASCTAGPAGSSGSRFTASQSLASVGAAIEDNGKVIASSSQLTGSLNNILNQVPVPSQLSSLLGGVTTLPASPIHVTINPGSTSGVGSGPVTTATAGEIGLSVNGTSVLDVVGAKATCGPNKPATTTAVTGTAPEHPLGGGIQTDEGRSGSGNATLWLSVAGASAAAAGGAGGVLWRRRVNRS
jgi:hypothetical protein